MKKKIKPKKKKTDMRKQNNIFQWYQLLSNKTTLNITKNCLKCVNKKITANFRITRKKPFFLKNYKILLITKLYIMQKLLVPSCFYFSL